VANTVLRRGISLFSGLFVILKGFFIVLFYNTFSIIIFFTYPILRRRDSFFAPFMSSSKDEFSEKASFAKANEQRDSTTNEVIRYFRWVSMVMHKNVLPAFVDVVLLNSCFV
jgi:hypothetical protein